MMNLNFYKSLPEWFGKLDCINESFFEEKLSILHNRIINYDNLDKIHTSAKYLFIVGNNWEIYDTENKYFRYYVQGLLADVLYNTNLDSVEVSEYFLHRDISDEALRHMLLNVSVHYEFTEKCGMFNEDFLNMLNSMKFLQSEIQYFTQIDPSY